jgi:hypothetical protein
MSVSDQMTTESTWINSSYDGALVNVEENT